MAGFTGMDIEAVKGLSNQMKQKADEIRQIQGQLTSALNGAQWVGPDRERFKSETLEQAGEAANQNAQQQEQASNT